MPELPSPCSTPSVSAHMQEPDRVRQALRLAGVCLERPEAVLTSLPFTAGDVTAGSESELQAVVAGGRQQVDLPLIIEQSNYFANMMKRAASGETSPKAVADLERFLADNTSNVWENSWVRFPLKRLSAYARQVLEHDLQADKNNPAAGQRADAARFFFHAADGTVMLRLPISYLIKLALADLIGSQQILPDLIRQTGIRLLGHYLNDNTSPETFSFNVVSLTPRNGMGRHCTGDRHPLSGDPAADPLRQPAFASAVRPAGHGLYCPPSAGTEEGANEHVRHFYVSVHVPVFPAGTGVKTSSATCSSAISPLRSQLNAVAKLREAGITSTTWWCCPISPMSAGHNGTHIATVAQLTAALQDNGSVSRRHEKLLAIWHKISEHFLPLFVGSYTAAPFRLAFHDFHPEKALGFLPHELDYTHLRMLWRRWRKKADISIFGQSITPFGPDALDSFISRAFGLKGDFVPDYRLVDYLVCLLSTDRSPALNASRATPTAAARPGAMGVFDEQMSVYCLQAREFARWGFSALKDATTACFRASRGTWDGPPTCRP